MKKLYGPQVNPLTRVVQGVSTSWDPSIATTRFLSDISTVVWSPCSRFIAIALDGSCEVVILDAVTLEQLHTMYPPDQDMRWNKLVYSPDGFLLTGCSHSHYCIVTWDLQTGGPISNIYTSGHCHSISYSECGAMLGVLFDGSIIIYDVLSCIEKSSHLIPDPAHDIIWTSGEYLQFFTEELESIVIWGVRFTSGYAPVQVGSLPIPHNFPGNYVLLPTLSWLALYFRERIVVWDGQHQKFLLDSIDIGDPRAISFSSDGNFFICGTESSEIHLWKKSPDGYLPYQKFVSCTVCTNPVFSQNGESIISFGDSVLQLWHTTKSFISSPSISTQASQDFDHFLLEFSPDGSLVAVARRLNNTVTILDVKSSNQQLVINIDIEIYGIGFTGVKIMVVGDRKIITWELPTGVCAVNVQENTSNGVQTAVFEHPAPTEYLLASVSPTFNHIAIGRVASPREALSIYDIHTGKRLAVVRSNGWLPGFTLDGNQVLCATASNQVDQWAIANDEGANTIKLEYLGNTEESLSGFPWHSSYGYQITDDGWVLNSRGKGLLWLPYQWRSAIKVHQKWKGKFLALLQSGLPEAVILELEV